MNERELFDLQREANELRIRLAYLEADIRRKEHDLWRTYQKERAAFVGPMFGAVGLDETSMAILRGELKQG